MAADDTPCRCAKCSKSLRYADVVWVLRDKWEWPLCAECAKKVREK